MTRPLLPSASWKLSMPPAAMAPQFREIYEQTPIKPYPLKNTNRARGYDWEVDVEAVYRLENMINEKWRLPFVAIKILDPTEHDKWVRLQGFFDGAKMEIQLHPLLAPVVANETLWHEIQHAYQEIENRMNTKGYNPFPSAADDPSVYEEHPIEIDAVDFAEQMRSVPLIKLAEKLNNPKWVPNELHLDRGDWDDGEELWKLAPQQLDQELAAMVTTFRFDHPQWQSYWREVGDDFDEPYFASWLRQGMPYYNNVWYHVTSSHYLPSIVEKGLQPGTGQNWPGMAVGNAVYLWGNIAMARAYFENLTFPQGSQGKHIILRVRDIDLQKIAPDHEGFGSWLEERGDNAQNWPGVDSEDTASLHTEVRDQSEWYQYLLSRGDEDDEGVNVPVDEHDALKILTELSPDLRTRLAEEIGTAVMYFGSIPPNQIDIAFMYTYEQVSEQFAEKKMDEDPNWMMTEENEDDYYAELDQYMNDIMQNAQIADFISTEEIQEMYENATDDEDDQFANSFGYKPVNQWQDIGVPDYGPNPTADRWRQRAF